MKRSAGILLPISSLPSKYGIGCFSKEAYRFVDWLKEAGQSYWQILPLGPTGYGDSPYQSFSAFAGNPYFISLEELIQEGLLTAADCENADLEHSSGIVDYRKQYLHRYPLLKKAYQNSHIQNCSDFLQFCNAQAWLSDYALFMALKERYHGAPWSAWDNDIRLRTPQAMEQYRAELAEEIGFYAFLQYYFFKQWKALKQYANDNGIQIIGDIPIYVAFDSADTWANPHLFQLDANLVPKAVAGCPPDGFSADGQLWGNPLYDWDRHRMTAYQWWISRMQHCFQWYDVVRIDHFRGFDEYYAIPYGQQTARNGHWEKGPGMELFRALENAIGKREVIAEDLGFMTDGVRNLVKESGFPNMKVLEFAFDARDTGNRNSYLPHTYTENCVAYTGTHDNQTIVSWFATITPQERQLARAYLCDFYTPEQELGKSFISLLMRSKANLCVIPLQDWLGLDDTGRMNTPATVGNNWIWRVKQEALGAQLCKEVSEVTARYGRGREERKEYHENI